MASGRAANSPEMFAVIERHWRHINDNFYPCPPQMLENLASLWVEDPRFAANYEKIRPGLAAYMRDAAKAWAAKKNS
jgi:MerR family transcriptional regulator, thiopeptide resistance regulator